MNKPKIYGTCKAGCQWETIHREELIYSATYLEKHYETDKLSSDYEKNYGNEICVFEVGKKYKVFREKNDQGSWSSAVFFRENYGHAYGEAPLPVTNEEYENFFIFHVRALTYDEAASQYTLIYDVNGERKEIKTGIGSTLPEQYLYIRGLAKVLLYNSDATIKGEKGEKGDAVSLVSRTFQGKDENGGNIYLDTFDDGTTAEFVAPCGKAKIIRLI